MTSEDRPESDQPDHDAPTLPPSRSAFDEPTLPFNTPPKDSTVPPVEPPTANENAPADRVRYFGEYELLEEIARGGMGVVFKARQINLNRIVALKMILAGQFAGEEDVQRFYTEAEAAAQLDHPGIVPIFEIGEHDGQHYFSMGYIEGQSLAQRIADEPLDPKEAAELTQKICDAISYAHDRNVIHRDLKPANILLDTNGQPKVTDFGLAKKTEADSNLTGTGQILGTPAYMPPEQASGNVDAVGRSADIYSLGAVLYCLLTGRPPFQATSAMDTLMQVLEKEPTAPRQVNVTVPVDLETICLKCLEKEPSRRYESAAALSDDLGRYLADEPIEARPSSAAYRLWRTAKRNRSTSLALVAAFLAVLGGSIFFFQSRQNASRERAAQQSAKGAQEALQRMQSSQGIQQLAIIPFRNLSGNPDEDWLGAGFASVLQTKLGGSDSLVVVGKGPMEEAAAALGIPANKPMDEAESLEFGRQLVVNHVITGEFQRVAGQIQVSARLVNTQTGAVDRGGMQVQGDFANVFDLQTDLANQCLAQLGLLDSTDTRSTDAVAKEEVTVAPAASVDAWMFLGKGQQSLATGNYDQAIRWCMRATEEDPQLWKAFRTKGIAHTRIDEVEESLQAFQRAIEINPQDWTSQAYFNLLSGRMFEGFAALDKATEVGDADLDLLKFSAEIAIAVHAKAGGDLDLTQLEAAIESHPDDEQLLVLLASAQTAEGQVEAAIETLEAAVKLQPRRPAAHLLLSLAYEAQGRAEEAARALAEAERCRAEGIQGFREFGDLYSGAGKRERAIEEFNKALELDPEDSSSHLELGELHLASNFPKALGHFESALIQRPKSLQVLSAVCRLFNIVGQNDKLADYALRWVEADPASYEAHQFLRLAYLKTGQVSKADAELAALQDLTPRHKTFFLMTGNTLIQASMMAPAMIDEAILVFKKGIEAYPDDAMLQRMKKFSEALKRWHDAQWQAAASGFEGLLSEFDGGDLMNQSFQRETAMLLATCYEQLGRITEAAETMGLATKAMPQFVLAPKAFSLFDKAGAYDEAIDFSKAIVASKPNDLRAHRDLVRYYALANRWDEAKQHFSDLPSQSLDDIVRQIHVGVALADWMEGLGQAGPDSAQPVIERLVRRSMAFTTDEEGAATIRAHSRWARFAQQILMIGPFDGEGGLEGTLPPEGAFDPDARYPAHSPAFSAPQVATWTTRRGRTGDSFNLQSLNPQQEPLIAYCATHLISPTAQNVTLVLGGSDRMKLWVNGEELTLTRRVMGFAEASAQLTPGANWLLVKTIDKPLGNPLVPDGSWSISIDAIDAKGKPAAVRWSTDPDVAVGDARSRVYQWEARLLTKQDVIDQIEKDPLLDDANRAIALDFATQMPEDGDRINLRRIREYLGESNLRSRMQTAVRAAGAACRANPSNDENFAALALACYRAGRFETAIKAADRACELRREQMQNPNPDYLAYLAMSHHQLGHTAEAQAALNRLRDATERHPEDATSREALRKASETLATRVPQR